MVSRSRDFRPTRPVQTGPAFFSAFPSDFRNRSWPRHLHRRPETERSGRCCFWHGGHLIYRSTCASGRTGEGRVDSRITPTQGSVSDRAWITAHYETALLSRTRGVVAERRASIPLSLPGGTADAFSLPCERVVAYAEIGPKLQYTGQSVWPGASCVSNLESNRLAGILAFNRSNLCPRPEPPDSALVRLARAS